MRKKGLSELSPVFYKKLPDLTKAPHSSTSRRLKMNRVRSESIYFAPITPKDPSLISTPLNCERHELKFPLDANPLGAFLNENSLKNSFVRDLMPESVALTNSIGRKEVQKLIEWLDNKLQKVIDDKHQEPNQLFEVANEIYSSCLTEVIKQISVQCKERGYLISRVWTAYKNLFEKALSTANMKLLTAQDRFAVEKTKIQTTMAAQNELMGFQLAEITQERDGLVGEVKRSGEYAQDLEKQVAVLREKVALVQERYKSVKNDLLNYKEDNRIFRIKCENLGLKNLEAKKRPWMFPKRFKRRDKKDFERLLESDPILKITELDENSLFPTIIKYEKEVDQIFKEDDFRDQSTSTAVDSEHKEIQTAVEDLCGETIAIKKRSKRHQFTSLATLKASRPVFFQSFPEYPEKTLINETQTLKKSPMMPELKKKHIRVRKLLTTVREVMEKQEYSI